MTRIKAVCLKDNLEGWVTTLGNAGTLYAEVRGLKRSARASIQEEKNVYSVTSDVWLPMEKEALEDSPVRNCLFKRPSTSLAAR